MGFQSLSKTVFSGVAPEHHILDFRILAQSFPTIIFQKTGCDKKIRIENPFVKASKKFQNYLWAGKEIENFSWDFLISAFFAHNTCFL